MPDKQKVTLYLSDELHRQFKIRSAVDGETMSSMAQKALEFYLTHSELVQSGSDSYGRAHQVHNCPQCDASVTLTDNAIRLVRTHGDSVVADLNGLENIPKLRDVDLGEQAPSEIVLSDVQRSQCDARSDTKSPDEGELITC